MSVMPTPRSLSIAITGRCNLHCQYCFYANEMVALDDLPTETWLDFFDELGTVNVMQVTLTGGEVFTRRDLFEMIDKIIENRMRYSLLTNGTLITEKTLAQFEGKRRTRLNSIQVSIDGSTAEIHNMSRPLSFDRAVRGLRLLHQAGFPVQVRVTLNRHNFRDLENIARFLLEDIGIASFSTNEAMPMGAGCHNTERTTLTSAEKLEAMHIIAGLLERYPNRLNASAGPHAKLNAYAAMEHVKTSGDTSGITWGAGFLTSCGCVFSQIDVLHDGTIVPCHIMAGVELGNIQANSIGEIWRNHAIMQALRERRTIPLHSIPGCATCEWNSLCNGGCPGLAHEMTGDFNQPNPEDCYRRFLKETGNHHVRHR